MRRWLIAVLLITIASAVSVNAQDSSSTSHATAGLQLEAVDRDGYNAWTASLTPMVTVVNFWATWCGPCREEFPAYVRLGKEFDSSRVSMHFVSMDFVGEEASVMAFLRDQGVRGVSYMRKGSDNAFIETVHPDWTGVLPATVLYGPGGKVLQFWQGEPVEFDELRARVTHVLPAN